MGYLRHGTFHWMVAVGIALTACAGDEGGGPEPVAQVALGFTSLPPAWSEEEVGTTGSAGATHDGPTGRFTVHGTGAGVRNDSEHNDYLDAMHFVFRDVTGDVELVVRLVSLSGATENDDVGVTIRSGIAPNDAMASGFLSYLACTGAVDCPGGPYDNFRVSWTLAPTNPPVTVNGGSTKLTTLHPDAAGTTPIWFRLQRIGADFSVARRTDDSPNWVPLNYISGGEFQSASAKIGMFVSGGATAVFDNVYVGPPRRAHMTTWIGSSTNRESTGRTTAYTNALYALPDGSQVYRHSPLVEALGTQLSAFNASTGAPIKHPPGNLYGSSAAQGAMTGMGSDIYFVIDAAVEGTYCIQRRDSALGYHESNCPPLPDAGPPLPGPLTKVGGTAVNTTEIFVSQPDPDGVPGTADDKIIVFPRALGVGASRSFSVSPKPGPIALANGVLWVVHTATDYPNAGNLDITATPEIKTYDVNSGMPTSKTIGACPNSAGGQLNCVINPSAMAYDASRNQLLVAENGVDQCIRVFDPALSPPQQLAGAAAWIGVQGGVYSGTAGLVTDASGGYGRFYNLAGLAIDDGHNVYVSSGPTGTDIQRRNDGGGSPWQVYGLLNGLNGVTFGPQTNGIVDVYSGRHHFTFNPAVTSPGGEWSLKAVTWNPFDPRGRNEKDEHRKTARRSSYPIVRDLNGQRFLFAGASEDEALDENGPHGKGRQSVMNIYRFDGEIAIPCGHLVVEEVCPVDIQDDCRDNPNCTCNVDGQGGSMQRVQLLRLWLDTNGNGAVDAAEEQMTVDPFDATHPWPEDTGDVPSQAMLGDRPPGVPLAADVDSEGNIWLAFAFPVEPNPMWPTPWHGSSGTGVWKLTRVGFAPGNYAPGYNLDPPDTDIGPGVSPVGARRELHPLPASVTYATMLRYDAVSKVMYMVGAGTTGTLVGAYDFTSAGFGSPRFERNLPDATAKDLVFPGMMGDGPFGYTAMAQAGDKLFVSDVWNLIRVLETTDGAITKTLSVGPEVSGQQVKQAGGGLSATKLLSGPNAGQYVVSTRDESGRGANSVYRWTPGTCQTAIGCSAEDACRVFWSAEENSGTSLLDSSGQAPSHTATLQGNATRTPGWDGFGVRFADDTQYADTPDSNDLDITRAITLALWINPDAVNRRQYLIQKGKQNFSDGYELALESNGKPFLRFNQMTSGDTFRLNAPAAVPMGVWTHVTATFAAPYARLFVNGLEVASANFGNLVIGTNARRLALGAQCTQTSSCVGEAGTKFKGVLDEARVFARALPPEQIAILARRGPVALFALNEGSGSVANDSSGACNSAFIKEATFGTVLGRSGLSFDGVDDYVEVSRVPDLKPLRSLTLAAWVRNSAPALELLISTNTSTTGGFELGLGLNAKPYARITSAPPTVQGTTTYVANGWIHLAVTYDGVTVRLYCDKIECGSGAPPAGSTIALNGLPLTLGARPDGSLPYSGQLDEVRFYRRALTPNEISALP